MPTLALKGLGEVQVGPEFMQLSAEQQAATVDEIAGSLRQSQAVKSRVDQGFDVAKPMQDRTLTSGVGAMLQGAAQGATANFGDEVGAALDLNVGDLFSGNLKGAYDKNLAARRRNFAIASAERPVATTAGEIGGALLPLVATAGGGAAATGAGRAGQAALTGGAYSAAAGFGGGEGLADRLTGAAVGGVTGAALGGVMSPLVDAAGAGARWASSHIASSLRGARNPEAEAARRVAMARQADDAVPQRRLDASDEATAMRAGQPILNVDRGGTATRSLARTAANQSPQARSLLETTLGDRFEAQGGRVADAVRRIANGRTTTEAREQLLRDAAAANRPAYERAFAHPRAAGMWDETLQNMAAAPVVQDAIRTATVAGRNAAAKAGTPVRNPFRLDTRTGRMELRPDENGQRVQPSLEFWNAVKIGLDANGSRDAQAFARALRGHLDSIVPDYASARSGAAKFFDAQDALEAGHKFVRSTRGNDEARQALARMSKPERDLFAEGFADGLVKEVGEVGDAKSVIDRLFLKSAASRERIEMALGPQRAQELEAFLRVEALMNAARREVIGNSTTTRQMIEAGAWTAGTGAGLYGLYNGDPKSMAFVIAGALVRGKSAKVNAEVATRVAKLLASEDPRVVNMGIKSLIANKGLLDALRRNVGRGAAFTGQTVERLNASPPRIMLNAGERDRVMAGDDGDQDQTASLQGDMARLAELQGELASAQGGR